MLFSSWAELGDGGRLASFGELADAIREVGNTTAHHRPTIRLGSLYQLARELLTSPADLARDSERALALSNRALELNPTDP